MKQLELPGLFQRYHVSLERKKYSSLDKEKALVMVADGYSYRDIEYLTGIGYSSVRHWVKSFRRKENETKRRSVRMPRNSL